MQVKVKAHRGDPLNEEADIMIRAEMGGLKEQQETIWNDLTDRTVYRGNGLKNRSLWKELTSARCRFGLTQSEISLY